MPLHSSLSSASVVVGIGLFLLAGHQTLRHRDMLKLRQEDIEALPFNVVLEVLLAAVLCMIGSLSLAGDFRPIHATANQEGVDMDVFRPDFMAFNHRGFALPLSVEPVSSMKKNKHQ